MRRGSVCLGALLLCATGVQAWTYLGFEQITVATVSIGMTTTKINADNNHPAATAANCRLETAEIRFTTDGTTPTTTVGTVLSVNDMLTVTGNDALQNFRAIRTGGDERGARLLEFHAMRRVSLNILWACLLCGVAALAAPTAAQTLIRPAQIPSVRTIYWERTNSTTTSTSAVPKFGTAYAIPGGTLARDGDRLRIHVSVTLSAATTDNKNLNCNIGYSAFSTSTGAFTGGVSVVASSSISNAGSLSWWVDAIVTRNGATTTSYEWQIKWGNTTTTTGANYTTDTSAITWANANNFLCAVYNTTPGTQTLTLNEYSLDLMPRQP